MDARMPRHPLRTIRQATIPMSNQLACQPCEMKEAAVDDANAAKRCIDISMQPKKIPTRLVSLAFLGQKEGDGGGARPW
jgi:hypothetical protein